MPIAIFRSRGVASVALTRAALSRFVIQRFYTQFGLILGFLCAILLTTQSLRLLAGLGNNELAGSILLLIIMLSLVEFLPLLLPLAILACSISTFAQMQGRKEWIVLLAVGYSPHSLTWRMLVAALLVSFASFFIQAFGVNLAHRAQNNLLLEAEFSVLQRLFAPQVFHQLGNNVTIFVESVSTRGLLKNVFTTIIENNEEISVFADSGQVARNGYRPVLKLSDGVLLRRQINNGSSVPQPREPSALTVEGGSAVPEGDASDDQSVEIRFQTLTWVMPSDLIDQVRDRIRLGRSERENFFMLLDRARQPGEPIPRQLVEIVTAPFGSFVVCLGIIAALNTKVWVRQLRPWDMAVAITFGVGLSIAWIFLARTYLTGGLALSIYLTFIAFIVLGSILWYLFPWFRWFALARAGEAGKAAMERGSVHG